MTAGIYLHIPFCKSRCSYCDFATDVWRSNEVAERYVSALCKEIAYAKTVCASGLYDRSGEKIRRTERPPKAPLSAIDIDTIYFGGGTPSLLEPGQLERILDALASKFNILLNAEITMEMNPATVTPEKLRDFRTLGVNRASFGVQTFDDISLKLLARGHDANDANQTYKMLRKAGFENVSFDLIAGLPGQTPGQWQQNLDKAISLDPEHLSLYLLEIHAGTPLAEQIRSGRQPLPDPELAAEMYEMMLDKLGAAHFRQYEISNFSRPGFESRHNSKYWTLDPVFGFGVSAHSFDGIERFANERDTAKYVEMIEGNKTAEAMRENIDPASEFVFLGLRMENGIGLTEYKIRFYIDLVTKYRDGLDGLIAANLVKIADNRLRLTKKGKLFSNEVFAVFV